MRTVAIGLVVASIWFTFQASLQGAEPLPAQRWNCLFAGGLIEGACVGVTADDQARIRLEDGAVVPVPLELFHAEEQTRIRDHFGVAAPELPQVDAAQGGHPWHSSRGGVIVMGKIIGRDGETLWVADDRGRRLRIPYSLLASGAQEHARRHVTELEGKEFVPATPKPAQSTSRQTPTRPQPARPRPTPPTPAPPMPSPPMPAPLVQNPPAPQPVPPTIPAPPASPEPRGPVRRWRMRSGVVMAEGQFLQISGPSVRVALAGGGIQHVPLELLMDADRQYAEALAGGGELGQVPQGALEIVGDRPQFIPTRAGRELLLIDGARLHVLPADGGPPRVSQDLGGEVLAADTRGDQIVAAVGNTLLVLDQRTLKQRAKHELWKYRRIRAVALHPQRQLAFVSVESSREAQQRNSAESQRVVIVDERTGEFDESGDVFGKFLAFDPAGRFLLVGYGETYQSGSNIHINPGLQVIETPEYENVDSLTRYQFDGTRLVEAEKFPDAGANGQGLVLSPDGGRVSYLGFAGYPTFSGNVVALEAANFRRKPVTFPMKDRSDCKRMAYHPALPWVVSPGGDGVVFYSSETGEPLDDKLAATDALAETAVETLCPTPDGKRLALIVSRAGSPRYLTTVELRLTAAEHAALRNRPATIAETDAANTVERAAADANDAPGGTAPAPDPVSPAPPALRRWTDATGKFHVDATLQGLEGGNVVLVKPDGGVVRVPLDRLSKPDQEHLRTRAR